MTSVLTGQDEPLDVARIPWPAFMRRFRHRFKQGDQITILGGPDAGKTHLAVLLAEVRDFTFFIATKPRDPLILEMVKRRWTVSSTLEPAEQLISDENDPRYGTPVYPRYVFWPQPLPDPNATLVQDSLQKAGAVQAALVVIKRHGSWCVLIDELNYLSQTLRLRDDLSELYHTARSNKVSIIGAGQRPSWIPRAAVDNPGHLFIFQAGDREELRRLGEIAGGLEWRPLAEAIATLRWRKHEFLYVGVRDRVVLISAAPPW